MELGLLNLMPAAGLTDESGFAVAETIDGDAFTKLIAQLGAGSPAPGNAVPTDTAALAMAAGAAGLLTPAATKLLKSESAAPAEKSDGASEAAPDDETTDGLNLASLGLPPLLAALMAPTAQAAAPAPTSDVAPAPGGSPAAMSPTLATPLPAEATLPGAARAAVEAKPATTSPAVAGKDQPAAAELPVNVVAVPVAATVTRRPGDLAPSTHAARAKGVSPVESLTIPPASSAAPIAPTAQALSLPAAAPIESAPMMAAAEATPAAEIILERQLDFAHEGEWLDQLAKDIARTGGDGQLRFRLNPEHLGSLHVELTQGAAGASVRLTADTEAARTIIADARPQLIAEARAQGVRIAEAHVDLGSGSQSQAGHGQRDGRELPERTYLTSWKPESAEETTTPPRRSTSERYA